MRAAHDEATTVEVWPDVMDAALVFEAMSTQWRVGTGGPCGLDYGVLPSVLRLHGLPRARWRDLFDDVRVMEAEALRTMHKDSP